MNPLLHRPLLMIAVVACLVLAACSDDGSLPLDPGLPEGDGVGEPSPADEPPPTEGADVERRMERLVFDLVNDERSARGLRPLAWDEQLAELARGWSRRMARDGSLEHQDPQRMLERSDGFSGVGENIFRSTGPVPASTVHVRWMRSEGHRVNVLRPVFDRLGVGFVCTEDGAVFATQRFGRSRPPATSTPEEDVPPEEPVVAEQGRGPSCPAA